MDLMPHIKALLDDIIKMTKTITVKRSDIADRYESDNDALNLYNQYLQVINNESTFHTYYKYPLEIFNKYTEWKEIYDNRNDIKPILNGRDIKLDNKTTISFNHPNEQKDLGNIWIQYNKQDMKFYKLYDHKETELNINNEVYEIDDSLDITDTIIEQAIFGDHASDIKTRSLYIYDEAFKKYLKVNITFKFEYENIGDNFNISDNWSYYEYDSETGSFGTLFRLEPFSDKMIVSSNGNYCLKYKMHLSYNNPDYYDAYTYFIDGTNVDMSRYSIYTDIPYYKNNNIYYPLYKESLMGSYYKNYENNEFVSVYTQIDDSDIDSYKNDGYVIYSNINGIYVEDYSEDYIHYINIKQFSDIVLYDRTTDEDVDIYYQYYDNDCDKITNYLINQSDPTSYRFKINDDNEIALYYTYSKSIEDLKQCKSVINITKNSLQWYTYIDDNEMEELVNVDDTNKYYFYRSSNPLDNVFSKITSSDTSYYKYANFGEGYYAISEDYSVGGNAYIFRIKDYFCYRAERIFTTSQCISYSSDRKLIPESHRYNIKTIMDNYVLDTYCETRNDNNYSIPLYYGEKNDYYRTLNGLPPLSATVPIPKLDRYKLGVITEGEQFCYIFQLTDREIEYMEENDLLTKYKEAYPTANYLNYLGKNRIDVVTAREASAYDILKIGKYEFDLSNTLFLENYKIAKNYVLNRQYYPELFGEHQYYHAYIGFVICVLAMIMCITKSGDILIQNTFIDPKTVDLVLKSFGFDGVFDKFPYSYRLKVARNIYSLIKNKGIDSIYKTIIDIFDVNADVYKYYIRNINGEIVFMQSAIDSKDIIKDILNDSNKISYESVTELDPYWDSSECTKEEIATTNFTFMDSKYITVNNRYKLTELNFNSTYLLNYLLDSSILNNYDIRIDINGIKSKQNLKNLIVCLFAINAAKFGFDGNIPSNIVSVANVYKFNLDETVVYNNGNETKIDKIINQYIKYMTETGRNKVRNILNKIDGVINSNNQNNSSASAFYMKKNIYDTTELIDEFESNCSEDSLYSTLLRYRDDAKNINDFLCFDNLITAITTSNELSKAYKLSHPEAYKLYEYNTDEVEDFISGIHESWLDDLGIEYITNKITSTQINNPSNQILEVRDDKIYYVTTDISLFNMDDIEHGTIVFEYKEGIITIYKICTIALTYNMYLRQYAKELYDYIQIRNESYADYIDRIDTFSSDIIASVNNDITKNGKSKMNISYADFNNIAKYIRMIINVFKSFTVDLANVDPIFDIDDPHKRINILDSCTFDENHDHKEYINVDEVLSYNELCAHRDVIKIKDELTID